MEIVQSCLYNRRWLAVSGIPIACASYIVVLALKALAEISRLFGCQESFRYFAYSAKKFYAVYVHHNSIYSLKRTSPLPLLTHSKNIARRDVILNEEDVKAVELMRNQFLSQNPYKSEFHKMRDAHVRGAKSTGICFGAASTFIKGCLEKKIESEAELVSYAKQFEEGFNEEAAALHWMYTKTQPVRESMKYLSELHAHYNTLLKMVRLQLKAALNWNLYVDLKELEQRSCFDAQDFGTSSVGFAIDSGGAHAVAFLKFSFGTYIFDNNQGLMSTGALAPSEALLALQKHYGSTTKIHVRPLMLLT